MSSVIARAAGPLLRMLGSLPDAEDAVQETLLRAWRYRDSLKQDAHCAMALPRGTNACLDAIAAMSGGGLGARAEADDVAGQPDMLSG